MPHFNATEIQNSIVDSVYTWGWVSKTGFRGNCRDFVAALGENYSDSSNQSYGNEETNFRDIFDFSSSNYNQTNEAMWFMVPINVKGWRTFYANVYLNDSANSLDVSAYTVPEINGDLGMTALDKGFYANTLFENEPLTGTGYLKIGPAGLDKTEFTQLPMGWLLIKMTKTAGGETEGVFIGVERSK